MRNTRQLESQELKTVERTAESVEEIENSVIEEHAGQISLKDLNEKELMKDLLLALSEEKAEGESATEYEKRITGHANRILRLQ